jgi:AraC-like DNA-binding protein
VDLRWEPCLPGLCGSLPGRYEALRVRSAEAIHPAIQRDLPRFLCFEYDHPEVEQLEALRVTRLSWPSLPVLMITVSHSEDLAVFALRMRVWDYLVMPVSVEELCARLAMLSRVPEPQPEHGWAASFSAARSGGHAGDRTAGAAPHKNRFGPAIGFVEENLAEKISLGEVARLCGLGRYQFSRAFKQGEGTTFREFLIQRRINRAMHLFDDPKASVTDVAFAVGFNDLSYFARVFRRFTGVSPSFYRQAKERQEVARLPVPQQPQDEEPGWPIAKYSYPTARKS